jgi:hypothetical protein
MGSLSEPPRQPTGLSHSVIQMLTVPGPFCSWLPGKAPWGDFWSQSMSSFESGVLQMGRELLCRQGATNPRTDSDTWTLELF